MKPLLYVVFAAFLISCSNQKLLNKVEVSERKILVDNQHYTIKGICYHPVPKGSVSRDFKDLNKDLELMKEAGINTIRLYAPIDDEAVLDQIDAAGIKVIVGFGYNQDGYFDILSGSFINYIEKYKAHPAILFWELGNEYNYHPEWFEGDMKNWYSALNKAAQLAHGVDSLRPVATAHGELPDSLALAICTDIDVWGMNVYRWDSPESIFGQWELISSKPMYLSEAGADSYMTIARDGFGQGINEAAQAQATKSILDEAFNNTNICSGVTLFAFVDELWKAGNPDQYDKGGWAPNSSGVPYDGTPNEEYWGILDINRKPKAAFEVVKTIYKNNTTNK